MTNELLESLSREQLIELLEIDSKNWVAMDGVWFQSVEAKYGMEEAIYHDTEAWKRFTEIEAKRIKAFLKLPDRSGLDGLEKALMMRLDDRINPHEVIRKENTLIYRITVCRVQSARKRKGMPYHPCKSVAEYEYSGFARVIDDRIKCRCLSCYPDVTDETCACAWEFTLND